MSNVQNEIPTIWTTSWTDVLNTGTWRAAVPVHEWRPSPCHVQCPVGGSIPAWIAQIGEGAYRDAWLTVVENNPLPAVTGRVCHHPCEANCNRAALEGPVGVNALEHFLGDYALEQGWSFPEPPAPLGKRVAVVGGGPAGLACAYHLRRSGYEVTIFEARAELGGLLRYGIPEYRLPKAVVAREVQRILDMGVKARTRTPIPDADALSRLQEEYDAVFVAVGAQRAKRLAHLAESAGEGRVLEGLAFLRRVNDGEAVALGGRVVVIGGGSAAMDVARTARRLDKAVTIVALEGRDALPAQEEEVVEALEEGIVLFAGAMVAGVDASGDALELDCRKVTLDPEAPSGVLRPIPVEGGDFRLEADTIIVSIGQDPALEPFASLVQVEQAVIQVSGNCSTSRPGVFAGGDVATIVRFVSEALGDGKRAAQGIAAYLGHPEAQVAPRLGLDQAVSRDEVNLFYFPQADRRERAKAAASERAEDFREIARALTAAEAATEAGRCLSCGTCVECDNCFIFCPDMAVQKDATRDQHYFILDQYCKGCGLCVAECPRGAVRLEQESR